MNTFGVPDPNSFSTPSSVEEEDPIEVSAAVAAAFTREENGLMGPPLSTKPRASTGTSVSTRSNRSSIAGSATGPQRPLSPPPNDLLIRAQSPAFDEIYARRGLLNVPNRAGGRGTASEGNLRGGKGTDSEGNETVVAGQGRTESIGRYASSSLLVGGISRTGGKRKNVDYSDNLSFSDLDDYSQTPTQARGASNPAQRSRSAAGTQNGRASMESGRTSEMEHVGQFGTATIRPPVPPKTYPSPPRTRPSANSTTLQTPRNRPSQNQVQADGDDASASTDPALIHAITQTMIGEFLHKYTRKPIGKGIVGGKRHERFFWVHPYTKMLYWSGRDPGAQNGGGENRSKSGSSCSLSFASFRLIADARFLRTVLIMGVRQIVDPNPYPEGLHSASIIIETSNRDITITASSRERHEMWYNVRVIIVCSSVRSADDSWLRRRSISFSLDRTSLPNLLPASSTPPPPARKPARPSPPTPSPRESSRKSLDSTTRRSVDRNLVSVVDHEESTPMRKMRTRIEIVQRKERANRVRSRRRSSGARELLLRTKRSSQDCRRRRARLGRSDRSTLSARGGMGMLRGTRGATERDSTS